MKMEELLAKQNKKVKQKRERPWLQVHESEVDKVVVEDNKRHQADTEPTHKQHQADTTKSAKKEEPTHKQHQADTAIDTESTHKQHQADTQVLPKLKHTNSTKPTHKQHQADTNGLNSIWKVTGIRRSVLMGLCEIARERRGTNIIGITYNEIAVRTAVKPSSVRTTMKRLRNEGWLTITAKRGNNRTIAVDIQQAYQLFVTEVASITVQTAHRQHPNDTRNDTGSAQPTSVVVFTTENQVLENEPLDQPTTATTGMEELKRQRQEINECLKHISFSTEARKYIGDDNVRELLRKGLTPVWIQTALDIFTAVITDPDHRMQSPAAVFMSRAREGTFLNPPRGYLREKALQLVAEKNLDVIDTLVAEEIEKEVWKQTSVESKQEKSLDDIPF